MQSYIFEMAKYLKETIDRLMVVPPYQITVQVVKTEQKSIRKLLCSDVEESKVKNTHIMIALM